MQVITIQSEAFQQLLKQIESIQNKLEEDNNKSPLSDKWLDNQDVCILLHISKRTLQSYRDNKLLPYSQIGSKIYYKAADIQQFLENNYSVPTKKK